MPAAAAALAPVATLVVLAGAFAGGRFLAGRLRNFSILDVFWTLSLRPGWRPASAAAGARAASWHSVWSPFGACASAPTCSSAWPGPIRTRIPAMDSGAGPGAPAFHPG